MLVQFVGAVGGQSTTTVRGCSLDPAFNVVKRHGILVLVLTILVVGLSYGSWTYATMTCFVHSGGVSNAPADGDTLCWADAELPKRPQTIEAEMGLSYMCDPSWFACSPLSGFEAGIQSVLFR
jgi:hypothetical protein